MPDPDPNTPASPATPASTPAVTPAGGDDFEVKFRTKGEFHAELARKTKSEVGKAIEATRRELLTKLGAESEDEIEAITAAVKTSQSAKTEAEKAAAKIAKLEKESAAKDALIAEGMKFRHTTLKTASLREHAAKVVDYDALEAFIGPKLTVGDDGKVIGPDGKSVEDLVNETIAAKPYLKHPDFKAGAGTKATTPKPAGGNTPNDGQNGAEKKSWGQLVREEMVAKGYLVSPGDPGP